MKKLILGLLFGGSTLIATAGNWMVDLSHSNIDFRVEHLGISWVAGSFTKFSGTVEAEKADFSDMSIALEIDPSSVNTRIEDRDKHLLSKDFFNVAKYNKINFKTMKVMAGEMGKLTLKGELEFLGVKAPINLDVKYNGTAKGPYGATRAGFTVSGTVDRYVYGMKYNAPVEGSKNTMMLGQNIKLTSSIELIKK